MAKYYDPVTKIIKMPEVECELYPDGLGCLLYRKMRENLEKIAQIEVATRNIDTYSDFSSRCIKAAVTLRSRGIKPGDVVSFCSHNHINSSVPFVASLMIGATTAYMDPTFTHDELTYMLNVAKPKIIFISDRVESLFGKVIDDLEWAVEVVVFGKSSENTEFDEFIQVEKEEEQAFTPQPCMSLQDTCIIVFSSGTSGLPKGICLSHKYFLFHINNSPFSYGLSYATMYWISSTVFTLTIIVNGMTRYVMLDFDPQLLWQYIQEYDFGQMYLSSSDAIKFYKNRPLKHEAKLQSLLFGGSCMPNEYLQKFKELFPKTQIHYGYGQTELYCVFEPISQDLKLGTVGEPMFGRWYKIVDPETEEHLGFRESGELRIKTQWCMNGYYNMDSSDEYDKDGFFKTGDILYYDEDFHFFVVDRIKEMFKYKSYHIVPSKIERILYERTDVLSCAVVGIPHSEDDNHALAVVQPSEDCKISCEEMQDYVESRLDDRHKLRAGLIYVDSLPRTANGKLKRRLIKDMFMDVQISKE